MRRPKPCRPIAAIIRPPLRKIIRTDLQLLGDPRGALAGHQPPYRRELDLPVENTSFCCGHPSILETVILVFVSHFRGALQRGVHPAARIRAQRSGGATPWTS